MPPSYQPIENYGIVGDLHTVALVGIDGAIDFMCFPRFDAPTIFAALLDQQRGGCFRLQPEFSDLRHKQLYLPGTNVLLTRFLSPEGAAEICDFMLVEGVGPARSLVRQVKALRGDIPVRALIAPRFDYGRAAHRVLWREGDAVFEPETPSQPALRLKATVPLRIEEGDVVAQFVLREGETASFALSAARTGEDPLLLTEQTVTAWFKATVQYWRRWIGRSNYRGRWREMIQRSALTLKLLTSAAHGSIVAAPTFGLPELIGGERNWDYRFTWIRDASFTVFALMRLGYSEEAAAFMQWIEKRCQDLNPDGSLQALYALDGRRVLNEEVLRHLEGYRGSKPVRIGNDAYHQVQLDIYGELMDAVYFYNRFGEPITYDFWTNLVRLIDWVCAHWRMADEGVWEVRGGAKEFLYSRVMCWVALDRGIRLAEKRSFPAPLEFWRKVRDEIHRDAYNGFWNAERQTFVQYKGGHAVDAASLLIPLVRFTSPHDQRWFFTLNEIERTLVKDSLVFRYDVREAADDGFSGQEGTFTLCSFAYVRCLAQSGDLDKARYVFEKALSYANHVGLYAEELGPCGEHLGNFPQAFTHLAIITTACDLDQKLSATE